MIHKKLLIPFPMTVCEGSGFEFCLGFFSNCQMLGLMLFEMAVLRLAHGNVYFPIFVSLSVGLRVVLKLVLQYFRVSITKKKSLWFSSVVVRELHIVLSRWTLLP